MATKTTPVAFKFSDDPATRYAELVAAKEKINELMDVTLKAAVDAGYGPSAFAKEVGQPTSNIRRSLRLRGLLNVQPRAPKAEKATKTKATKATDAKKTAAAKKAGRIVTTTTHVANKKTEPNVSTKAGRRALNKKAS